MAYERVNWENLPSTKTPVNADNLNKMDKGIAEIDEKMNSKQDKLTAGTGIEITGTNIINNLNANYSTEEQVIGRWINNKPLYKKTYSGNCDTKPTQILDASLPLSVLVGAFGNVKNAEFTEQFQLGLYFDSTYNCSVNVTDEGLRLAKGTGLCHTADTYNITILYTKTTD